MKRYFWKTRYGILTSSYCLAVKIVCKDTHAQATAPPSTFYVVLSASMTNPRDSLPSCSKVLTSNVDHFASSRQGWPPQERRLIAAEQSTPWRCARGRPTLQDKAIRLLYLCLPSSLAQSKSEFVSADHVSILMNQA
jgi:hypothetical protein